MCTNTEGGFTCECKEGWSGDGVSRTGNYNDQNSEMLIVFHKTFNMLKEHRDAKLTRAHGQQ